ncbi:MAG: aspartate aminotransferase family protein [Christensenellaceae bacterium]
MELEQIKQLDNEYFMPVYGERLPVAFARGEGINLFDTEGNKYTDFLAGIAVNSLGYSNEGFKNALKEQIDKLIHISNYFYIEPQAKLAQTLCQKTGYGRVFFSNSGSEANECAIKIAKKYAYNKGSKSANFVSLKGSFHGRTLAALTATGQDKFHEPFQPGTFTYEYLEAGDMDALNRAINGETCGVLLEVIQGEGGVNVLEKEYVQQVRALCDKHDALLIIDEVQTGMGRTGTFLAQEQFGVKADVTTLAKALGNGVPIGACLATEKAAQAFSPGDHGTTFGGNYLACSAALYVLGEMTDSMLKSIAESGEYFLNKLAELKNKYAKKIVDVRGMGLLIGAELAGGLSAQDIKKKLLQKGFVVGTAGANTLRFLPPYIVEKKDIDALADALGTILE